MFFWVFLATISISKQRAKQRHNNKWIFNRWCCYWWWCYRWQQASAHSSRTATVHEHLLQRAAHIVCTVSSEVCEGERDHLCCVSISTHSHLVLWRCTCSHKNAICYILRKPCCTTDITRKVMPCLTSREQQGIRSTTRGTQNRKTKRRRRKSKSANLRSGQHLLLRERNCI